MEIPRRSASDDVEFDLELVFDLHRLGQANAQTHSRVSVKTVRVAARGIGRPWARRGSLSR